MKARIASKTGTATDICAFELAATDGGALPPFSAGAHIDVQLPNGLVRQYSLCGDPRDTQRYLIGVLRDPASRGGSAAMHALAEGTVIDISEPKNHFPLANDAQHSILLAGGIGVTPILCMAERLAHLGASFELHYRTRSPERTAFRERLQRPDMAERVRIYFDTAAAHERLDLAAILARPQSATHVYVCGPGGFIEAVLRQARESGWAEGNLHREFFNAPQPGTAASSAFQVKLASSGRVVDVGAGQTVLEALRGCGMDIPTACEQGVCGTCLTRVLAGEPEHRDVYLTEAERAANDQFLPCCSRSRTALLTLDL
jgi:vanillate O-demethylase ferredoxin subunit